MERALTRHEEWYKGDGWYGDGPDFHLDYYNSFVIQPMLMQILEVVSKHEPQKSEDLKRVQKRCTKQQKTP